jgi:2-oxoglutarate dehydrogenase E2 component (dihydrolipoamide succinyltransferase)
MSGLADVVAPMNEEGTKATVLRWCKIVGDSIRKDEPLLELETDKVTVEIPSPASGELLEILKQPDEEVLPGQVLARLRIGAETAVPVEKPGAEPSERVPGSAISAQGARRLLSPAVRRLLAEHALSPADIVGSGQSGRITAEDIARHLDEKKAVQQADDVTAAWAAPETSWAASESSEPEDAGSRAPSEAVSRTRLAHTPIRRRVAEHMARSLAQAPHVTTVFEADLTRVQAHRARHASEFERRGVRLTLTAYFVVACARALHAYPVVNATFHEDALELHPDANIGVGTALGNEGLIVPVLHRAQSLDLFAIARRLGELVAAARAGKLAPEDVRGGTFTISNHGVGGSLLAAPIVINQPQVAILGIGKVERRVCVLEVQGAEVLGVRSMCYLTLTLDHRALDAFQANAYLKHVVSTLEQWPQD